MTNIQDIRIFTENLTKDPAVKAHFASDLSYWWANIMYARFSENIGDITTIIYNASTNAFGVIVNGYALNAYGDITANNIDEYVGWEMYYTNYPEEANLILRDRVYLISPKNWEEFCHKYGRIPDEP